MRTYRLTNPLAHVSGKNKAIRIPTDAMGEAIAIGSGTEPLASAATALTAGLRPFDPCSQEGGSATVRSIAENFWMKHNSLDAIRTGRKPTGAAVFRPGLTTALFRAFFEEWAETGYAAVSLERVAARAGAGKAAIYRRWPSKLAFACEAIQAVGLSLADFEDRGSLREELAAALRTTRVVFRHPLMRRIIPDAVAERARTPELSAILDSLAAARRRLGNGMLDRAIARNELHPDIDRELALDFLVSSLYMRMIVRRKNVSLAELNKQVLTIESAIKAC
ncbi:TetR-like C-terminal domain-containing protein [Pseudotabrizicola sp. 4114]|uniref:TetR-like C-terminal domain-containing protein n=1 Tax=Pseudotabrizicola sp. 4114 TaxID=2817731 RepID=UPI00285CBBCD|nr:AcrR family transcriptional regulator [Pseudorhodobacter sp. 4114]